jgi:hypothetical protein
MAGTSERGLAKIGPWPAGVDNVAPEDSLPVDPETRATLALRQAVNVDLDNDGWPSRRVGTVERIAATRAHSLFATEDYLYAWVDGALVAYDRDLALAATIRSALGERYLSYARVNDELYWSNGVVIRRMDADFGDHPVAVPTPPTPTVELSLDGGMTGGAYEVAITWVDDDGRESGACPSTQVIVPEGGGITVYNLPAAGEDVVETRVYCTSADGDLLYLVANISPAQPMLYIGGSLRPGKLLDTAWLLPLPPGDIVRFWNGRVLVAAMNLLCWSESLRFGLMHQDSMLRFGARITLMEPVGEGGDGAGVFIADHKRTYFMSGESPEKWSRVIRYPHAAVPGTSVVMPGTAFGLETTAPVAFWMAANGVFVLGLPGGKVVPITEGRLALPDAERGAAMFRETAGLRQIVTSFLSGERNALGVTDSASATIRRHGVTVS